MQENPAQKLSVEGAQAKGTARSLAAVGKGFGQQIVKVLARIGPLGQLFRAQLDLVIA